MIGPQPGDTAAIEEGKTAPGKLAATPGTEFLWTGNAALPGPVGEVLPEAIQGYTAPLFQAETEESDALLQGAARRHRRHLSRASLPLGALQKDGAGKRPAGSRSESRNHRDFPL